MNKLNPIYIIVLFVTILFISLFILKNNKETYSNKISELNNVKKSSKEYLEYKSNWNNKKFVEDTLNKILNNKKFESQKILRASTDSVLKIKIQSEDEKILNDFLNKVLNKKFLINKLQLEKDSVSLEIGLKI